MLVLREQLPYINTDLCCFIFFFSSSSSSHLAFHDTGFLPASGSFSPPRHPVWSIMNGERRGPPRVSANTSLVDVPFSEPVSQPVGRKITSQKPALPLVVGGAAVDGRTRDELLVEEERVLGPKARFKPWDGSNEDVPEKTGRALRRGTSSGSKELPDYHSRSFFRGISLGGGRRTAAPSSCRSHPRFTPHLGPSKRGSSASLPRQLSGFAALLFLLSFYVGTCLRKGGRFSGLSSGLTSSHGGDTQNRENNNTPPYSDGRGPIRRLAGEGLPRQPSDPSEGRRRKTTPSEEALCSAIEATTAGNRAAASQTVGEESDQEDTPPLTLSTASASRE